MKLLFLIIIISFIRKSKNNFLGIDLDNFRNSAKLIESRGFISETHTITTSDGYFLNVFRVINPYANRTTQKPVILWHGVTVNSDSWLISTNGVLQTNGVYIENNNLINDCHLSVTSNLALTLSSCGYDVWLPNTRGTEYSRKHQVFNPDKKPEYWEFTLTELGVYDVRAVVEYVLGVTKQNYVGYIGHSMGTTSMFILLSLQPEFETFVRPFIAMAPFVYMSRMRSAIRMITGFEQNLRLEARPLGIPISISQFVAMFICANQYFNELCAELLFYTFSGYDPNQFNKTRIPIYVSHAGATYSTWIYAHIAQLIQSGRFSGFDYGDSRNIEVYGQAKPPNYPLSRIRSKNIAIFYSTNDYVANISDVQMLINQLSVTLLDNYLVPYNEWAHQDFQYGIHQGYYVNTRILRLLNSF